MRTHRLHGRAELRASRGRLAGGVVLTLVAGAIAGQVSSAEAQKAQAELVYRQTILNAFRDTNDALVGTQKTVEGVALQRERVRALREFARLSRLKFESGLNGYLEVLVAETELFAAELAGVALVTDRYTEVVNVYQAMSGGEWIWRMGARRGRWRLRVEWLWPLARSKLRRP